MRALHGLILALMVSVVKSYANNLQKSAKYPYMFTVQTEHKNTVYQELRLCAADSEIDQHTIIILNDG